MRLPDTPRCAQCLFCDELEAQHARCLNADVADEAGWNVLYQQQGYLEVPYPGPEDQPCFWFVPKQP